MPRDGEILQPGGQVQTAEPCREIDVPIWHRGLKTERQSQALGKMGGTRARLRLVERFSGRQVEGDDDVIDTELDQPVDMRAGEVIAVAEQLDPARWQGLSCRRDIVHISLVHKDLVGADQDQLAVIRDRAEVLQNPRIECEIEKVVAAEPIELCVRTVRAAAIALRGSLDLYPAHGLGECRPHLLFRGQGHELQCTDDAVMGDTEDCVLTIDARFRGSCDALIDLPAHCRTQSAVERRDGGEFARRVRPVVAEQQVDRVGWRLGAGHAFDRAGQSLRIDEGQAACLAA